jgi:ATP-dependent DNA helicase RecG
MSFTEQQILNLIGKKETLTVEFKSDRSCLSDGELVAAIVAIANTEGGTLLLGVEDDGKITGLHPKHQSLVSLPAMIANKTNPPLAISAELIVVQEHNIACIKIPKSKQLVSTSDGLLQRRRLKIDGTPEAVPFYPHEFMQRQSAMGLVDPSAIPVSDVNTTDLDPLQRLRIRNAIKKYGGDQNLLALADDELDGAMGLVTSVDGKKCPTVAGLLLLGNEVLLRQHLPAYEVAFQVLRDTDVIANEFFRKPLLETFEEIDLLFRARVNEEEMQVGLFRVPVPNYDRRAFREAFVNSLVHRDYSRLGAVHVKLDSEGLSISNPGGFVEGVTLNNLLVVPPHPRNSLLADIVKRIGLAERTGRGIDRIYEGLLRYGRPAPDYSASDSFNVIVKMSNAEPNLEFLNMILQRENQLGVNSLPVDSLIILSKLSQERRLVISDFVDSVQKPEASIRANIEKLVEAGMVEPHGSGRGRFYTLRAKIYKKTGKKAAYVRQAGFDTIQQEQMILNFIKKHGVIKRSDVVELCQLTPPQAYHFLKKMKDQGKIRQTGVKRHAFYTLVT